MECDPGHFYVFVYVECSACVMINVLWASGNNDHNSISLPTEQQWIHRYTYITLSLQSLYRGGAGGCKNGTVPTNPGKSAENKIS